MKIRTFILWVIFLVYASCGTSKLSETKNNKNFIIPPGTIRISDNIFFDKAELSNIGYLEFVNWMSVNYGKNSPEYIEILPDTTVWSKLHPDYISLDTLYFRNPAYYDFPVVGVSFEQAQKYATWRSDRVFEQILIEKKIIPWIPDPTKDSVFTIEKYFKGQYYNIPPDPRIQIYPYYSLPTSAVYKKASFFADSLNARNNNSCYKTFCHDKFLTDMFCHKVNSGTKTAMPYGKIPLKETVCIDCKKELITHLKGNVRELTNVKGQFYGYSFIDSCNTKNNAFSQDTFFINSYTGFRNMCTFKKRGE
jgi:hypothetical protein